MAEVGPASTRATKAIPFFEPLLELRLFLKVSQNELCAKHPSQISWHRFGHCFGVNMRVRPTVSNVTRFDYGRARRRDSGSEYHNHRRNRRSKENNQQRRRRLYLDWFGSG